MNYFLRVVTKLSDNDQIFDFGNWVILTRFVVGILPTSSY